MAGKTGKARAFAFLIYPESWPTWRHDLSGLHMPVVVSPLHDRDVWTDEDELNDPEHVAGTAKKPHRHAIISWGNATTIRAALNMLDPWVKYVEPVGSYSGYCRYLLHLDDEDKARYDATDVVCLSGAVPDYERKLTDSEVLAQRAEIRQFCDDNDMDEYADLVDFCFTRKPDWAREVSGNTIFWRGYLESARHRAAKG